MVYHTQDRDTSPLLGPHGDDADGAVIAVRGLRKRYGELEAVGGVEFDVARGETFGFLGPNGAGKTTTINMLRSHIWSYIDELKRTEDITIFLTTHYMDEAEHCDRIAIIDNGTIVALGTPEALKGSVGKDRVQIQTPDNGAAIAALRDTFGLDAAVHEGLVTISVDSGEQFVPRLFAELGLPIESVRVSRPTLDHVFMSYTERTIRDAEAVNPLKAMARLWRGRR